MATVRSRGRASGIEPLEVAFDSAAVGGLYERNAGRIFGYCLSRLGRREDAEDAVQTTFLHAIRGLRRGVVPLIESAWLLGIARNVCLARREAFGRRKRLEIVSDPHDIEDAAPAPQTTREELMGLQEALAKLPENQRRAVLLRDWRGFSYEEIATELEVSHSAVETLIFRGRENLAGLLGEEPRQTRKRLASLGNIGSFFAAIKTAFTGGAAVVKVAAAVVAVSTAGLAAGSLESSAGSPRHGGTVSVSAPAVTKGVGQAQRSSAAPVETATVVAAAVPTARARSKSAPARSKRTPASKPGERPKAGAATASTAAAASAAAADSAAAAAATAPADERSAAAAQPAARTSDATQAPVVSTVSKEVAGAAKEATSGLPVPAPAVPTPAVATPAVAPPAVAPPAVAPPAVPTPAVPAPQLPPVGAPSIPGPPVPAPVPPPPLPPPPAGVDPPPLPPVPPVEPPPVPAPPVAPPPIPPPPKIP